MGQPLMKRTNVELDDRLVQEGLQKTGLSTKKELIHLALHELIRRGKVQELLQWKGKVRWEGNLDHMRRSRFDPR